MSSSGAFLTLTAVISLSPPPQKDDDIEEGDLPEHKRPAAPIDFSRLDPGKPESILKMTKKGKTLMMFVTVSGSPTEKEMEEITSLWQGSLFNANYDVQRWVLGLRGDLEDPWVLSLVIWNILCLGCGVKGSPK